MIWAKKYSLTDLQPFLDSKTMVSLLGIQITEIADDYLRAQMPVDERTHQIHGILHGGASCALVETVGSFASLMCIDLSKQYAVGSQINVNHIRPIKTGMLVATCRAVHVGRKKHVWDVMIDAQDTGKLIAKGELTCAVLDEPML
jgi:1,4-dihydroxy-2-naphthoyl-CoA hydrolase